MFFAELNEMLVRELAEDGYSGVEVRVTPLRTEIIIRATRTANVLGEKGRRIRELTSLVQRRFGFAEGTVELYAEKVNNRGLCAIAQCESLRYKLLGGLAVRRYVYHDSLTTTTDTNAELCFYIFTHRFRGVTRLDSRATGRDGARGRTDPVEVLGSQGGRGSGRATPSGVSRHALPEHRRLRLEEWG